MGLERVSMRTLKRGPHVKFTRELRSRKKRQSLNHVHRDSNQVAARGRGPHSDSGDDGWRGVSWKAGRGGRQHERPATKHSGHRPRRPRNPERASLYPWEHDPFPHSAGHAQERSNVQAKAHGESRDGCWRRQICPSPSKRWAFIRVRWFSSTFLLLQLAQGVEEGSEEGLVALLEAEEALEAVASIVILVSGTFLLHLFQACMPVIVLSARWGKCVWNFARFGGIPSKHSAIKFNVSALSEVTPSCNFVAV